MPFPTNTQMKRVRCPTDLHSHTNTNLVLTKKTWTMVSKNSYSNCYFTFALSPLSWEKTTSTQVKFTVNTYLLELRHAFIAHCSEDIANRKNCTFLPKAASQNELLYEILFTVIHLHTHKDLVHAVHTTILTERTGVFHFCSLLEVYNSRTSCTTGLFRTRRGRGAMEITP